jgi:formylglycine-generating enzyme
MQDHHQMTTTFARPGMMTFLALALAAALAGCSRQEGGRGGGGGAAAPGTGGASGMMMAGTPTSSGGAGPAAGGAGGAAGAGAGGAGGTGSGGTGAGGSVADGGQGGDGAGGAMAEPGDCSGCGPLEQCAPGKLCVARSVRVPAGFSIDATEVTRGQYAAWLATVPAKEGQATACAWNDSFTPDAACMARPSVCQGDDGCARHPQPCVDSCDASAYCKSVGKKLCGAIAGDGPVTRATFISAQASQWFNACSSNGSNYITYGQDPIKGNCNDFLSLSRTTVAAGSKPGCQSAVAGYAGIFDLIGNLEEWEDNCQGQQGRPDICQPRGLPFGIGAALPHCSQERYALRADASDEIGFRCCSR